MRNKAVLIGCAVCVTILLLAAVALSASPLLQWGFIGSGGGRMVEPQQQLVTAIGLPVAGKVSNGYNLYSGFYLNSALTSSASNKVFLPNIINALEPNTLRSTRDVQNQVLE